MQATPEPIPVLLLACELGAGGSERQLTEIARRLNREQFQPYVGFFREGIRLAELEAARVPCIKIPITSFLRPNALSEAAKFAKFLTGSRMQIVHAFDYPLACFGLPIARVIGVPVVLSSQRAHRSLIPRSYAALLRMTDLFVDGIVVNCRAMQQHLVNEEGLPKRKIHLCYNGLDLARFETGSADPDSNRPPDRPFTIGSIAVLRPEKNLHLLLRAAARLRLAIPRLQVIIVGNGPERDNLRNIAARLEIADRCLFQPEQQDVAPWIRRLDVFVLPSTTEALSNSLMEAMACACPVLASHVGGNPELVRNAETGLLFRPGDAEDLARKISVLAADANLRRCLSERACNLIREHFTLDRAARRMGEIYHTLLGQILLGQFTGPSLACNIKDSDDGT